LVSLEAVEGRVLHSNLAVLDVGETPRGAEPPTISQKLSKNVFFFPVATFDYQKAACLSTTLILRNCSLKNKKETNPVSLSNGAKLCQASWSSSTVSWLQCSALGGTGVT